MKTRQVQARSWYKGGKPLQELQGCEFEVTGTVPPASVKLNW